MKKGRIANVLLIGLILSSVYLTARTWFVEELWPEGYNFFVSWENVTQRLPSFLSDHVDRDHAPRHDDMFLPYRIVVNRTPSSRSMFGASDREFADLHALEKEVLNALFSADNPAYLILERETDFYDAVKSKSILFQYPVSMPTSILGQLYEYENSAVYNHVTQCQEILLVPGDSITNEIAVIMHDRKSNTIYKYFVPLPKTQVEEAIELYSTGNAPHMLSAYELGFSKHTEPSEFTSRVTLDPFVFMDTTNTEGTSVALRGFNPFLPERLESMDSNKVDRILKAFGCNPNTIRKYIDKDYVMVFIENDATIKLHPNGLLEYIATNPKRGIFLQENNNSTDSPESFLDSVDALADLITELWHALDMPAMPEMRVASDIADRQYGSFRLCMDYWYNDMPVVQKLAQDDITTPMNHAVEVSVENHRLVSFRVLLRSYQETQQVISPVPVLQALNHYYQTNIDGREARDIFLGFFENSQQETVYPRWHVSLQDGTVIPTQEGKGETP